MNRRGIVEDWFDFMFTLLAAFLLFILIHGLFVGSIADQYEETIDRAERITTAYNFILEHKIDEEKGKIIDIPELRQQLAEIQQTGYVSSPADFSELRG